MKYTKYYKLKSTTNTLQFWEEIWAKKGNTYYVLQIKNLETKKVRKQYFPIPPNYQCVFKTRIKCLKPISKQEAFIELL